MLRLASYDIVFQEVPGEVTLALNLSGCPNRCPGCHSPHLWEESGEVLDSELLAGLLDRYGDAVTCVCWMGGDASPAEVEAHARFAREYSRGRLKTAWYSGSAVFPAACSLSHFDYLKLGPYREQLGGLNASTTNQRFYRIAGGKMNDITELFQK